MMHSLMDRGPAAKTSGCEGSPFPLTPLGGKKESSKSKEGKKERRKAKEGAIGYLFYFISFQVPDWGASFAQL